jgi:hypothetical protein
MRPPSDLLYIPESIGSGDVREEGIVPFSGTGVVSSQKANMV